MTTPRPVSLFEATCRVIGTSRKTGRLQAAGYFRTEEDAERWILATRERPYYLSDLYIELPAADGEYVKLGLL